ncbi:MAG: hypothetical protein ACLSE6_03740 [Alphaproteobacteria bacterium]
MSSRSPEPSQTQSLFPSKWLNHAEGISPTDVGGGHAEKVYRPRNEYGGQWCTAWFMADEVGARFEMQE